MVRRHQPVQRSDTVVAHGAAFAARDARAVAETFTDDGVLDPKPLDNPSVGRERIAARYEQLFAAFPDLTVQHIRRYVQGDQVVEELICSGTHSQQFLGVPASLRPLSVRTRLVYRLRDGAISQLDAFWDVPTMLMQMGAPQSNRFADAGAVAASLLSVDLGATPVELVGPTAQPPPAPPRGHRGARRRGLVPLILAVVLLVAAGVGVAAVVMQPAARVQRRVVALPSSPASPSVQPSPSPSPTPSPAPSPESVFIGGVPLASQAPAQLAGQTGRPFIARKAPVLLAAPHDGFWLGTPAKKVWVELADEVPYNPNLPFKVGELVSFTGVLVANTAGFDADCRVDNFVDFRLAIAAGYHVEANYKKIVVG